MKSQKVWQTIATIFFIIIGILVVFLFIEVLSATLESRTQQNALDSRVTTLEQEIQTIKESLDAKGFTDLNM